jgi:hypothetical protein
MSDDIKDVSTRGALVAIALGVIVVAIVLTLAVFHGTGGVTAAPDKKRYQAIFLTNGQVYFGHLTGVGGEYITLRDVYYIQSQNPTQGSGQASASPQPNLSLVALGSEIHGPDKEMHVASSQLIFWENLKDDGKVVDAINNQNKK